MNCGQICVSAERFFVHEIMMSLSINLYWRLKRLELVMGWIKWIWVQWFLQKNEIDTKN